MRITTWNVNGLRAALRKGFLKHLDQIAPDVLLLQEIRVFPEQLPPEISNPDGWQVEWHPAQRPGYSGTAVWSRLPFREVSRGVAASDPDDEGRLLEIEVDGIAISSVYLPSGSSGEERQKVKDQWLVKFRRWASARKNRGPVLFGGDLNVAHTPQDIFYAKSNENTSGYLPHEREWFGKLLKSGWHDLVREHYGSVDGPYSWWSNRGNARTLDRGWRIDYLLCNAALRQRFKSAQIHREGGLEVSDHAPVSVDLVPR
ncbi:MAG: exodeoxyribonuclease III [Planctomycetaceae bacterium]|nr:exodeoxyribonuclease III [Planctomycetaceae bacterium]